MEAQDKITEQIKEAARKMESAPAFPSMERVWQKLEERLDEPGAKRVLPFWKKGIAAAVLVLIGFSAFYLLRRDNSQEDVEKKIAHTTVPKASPGNEQQGNNPAEKAVTQAPVKKAETTPRAEQKKLAVHRPKRAVTGVAPSDKDHGEAVSPGEDIVAVQVPEGSNMSIVPEGNSLRTITGKVVDEKLEPMPGVSVVIKGTTTGTTTDMDGNYAIEVNSSNASLIIKGIGVKDKEVPLQAGKNNLLTKLEEDNTYALNELSIYGKKMDKRSYTGALSTVTAKDIARRPVADVVKTLDGTAPGVVVNSGSADINPSPRDMEAHPFPGNNYSTSQSYSANYSLTAPAETQNPWTSARKREDKTTEIAKQPVTNVTKAIDGAAPGVAVNSGGGQPGTTPDILMRGVGSVAANNVPLIVLDGKPYNGTLVSVNPNSVDKIEFLKDNVATALYGSRGANGVILITTKKEKGTKSLFQKVKRLFKKKEKGTTGMVTPQAQAPEEVAIAQESYNPFVENPFENPLAAPLSTFSIDVDNASYSNIRRFINNKQRVPKDAVRIEEMINYFSYKYPQPKDQHPFSINTEYSGAPWNPRHKLLKIGLQGRTILNKDLPASNLVFLIDVSGSMTDENKLPLLVASMKLLINQLRAKDKVAIVVYAGAAGLVLPATPGSDKEKIAAALDRLYAGGSTAGGAGIQLAYQVAAANFIKGGNNRVILATDGDFNIGASSDSDMQTLIEAQRKSNIFLTCLGYGMGNYKDAKMEILADKGNGNYAYIDNLDEANRFLVKAFGGTMYSIAKDVKIQIEFNPAYVQSYRLIGYENRKLRTEDFVNDAVDAGELGSGHTVTALYEIIPAGVPSVYAAVQQPGLKYTTTGSPVQADFRNELATVKFRYKKPDGDKSIEMVQVIGHKPIALAASSTGFKLAASVAWFGLKLRDSDLIPDKRTSAIIELALQGIVDDKDGYKSELVRLMKTVQQ